MTRWREYRILLAVAVVLALAHWFYFPGNEQATRLNEASGNSEETGDPGAPHRNFIAESEASREMERPLLGNWAEDAKQCAVRTINAITGESVGGIEFCIYEWEFQRDHAVLGDNQWLRRAVREGRRYRTDTDGEAVVLARSGEGFAVLDRGFVASAWPHSDKETIIELRPCRSVTVHVVNQDGAAIVGAPVAYIAREPGTTWASDQEKWRDESSSPDGELSLPLTEFNVGGYNAATLVGVFVEPVAVELDLLSPPSKVELRVPAVGSVRVVLDIPPEARWPAGDATVSVAPLDAEGEVEENGECLLRSDGGVYQQDWVGLGQRLRVQVVPPWGAAHGVFERDIDGPTHAGEVVKIEIHAPILPTRLMLEGRLLDETGEVLRDCEIECEVVVRPRSDWSFGERDWTWKLATDKEGRFQTSVSPPLEGEKSRLRLFKLRLKRPGRDEVFHRIDLSEYKAELRELGDVKLARLPVSAAGRVLDDKGKALAGVEVSGASTVSCWRDSPAEEFVTKTGENGEFSLRGDFESDGVTLNLKHPGFTESRETVALGTGNLKFVLFKLPDDPLVTLELKVRGGGEPEDLRIRFDNLGTDSPTRSASYRGPRCKVALPAGWYIPRILGAGNQDVLLSLPEIVMRPHEDIDLGVVEVDYSEQRVDLLFIDGRTGYHVSRGLKVFDSSGKELPQETPYREEQLNDESRIWLSEFPARLRVEHEDYRAKELTISKPGPLRVVLEAGIWIEIRLCPPENLMPRFELGASLTEEREGVCVSYHSLELDHYRARCRLARPGRYDVKLNLRSRDHYNKSVHFGLGAMGIIDVKESSNLQSFEIAIDPQTFQNATESLKPKK